MKGIDVFGCDIGNGFAYISLLEDNNLDPVSMFPVNKDYYLDKMGMPTSAYIVPPDGNNIEVFDSRSSYDIHVREPEKFIHAVKTRLKEVSIPIPGISTPVLVDNVYAAITRDLINLGNEVRKSKNMPVIRDIVFTFPASFLKDNNIELLNRMQRSIESVQIEGESLRVVGRLPEPAAVAIDYLFYMQNLAPKNIRIKSDHYTALVYDLGHGTFDAAVVTASNKGKPYELHFSDGLPDVGGKDFDNILYDEICKALKNQDGFVPKNSLVRDQIKRKAVELKHSLSDNEIEVFQIMKDDGEYAEIEVTRELFEKKAEGLIKRTFIVVDKMINQAKDLGLHVDAVVLSGGASQMPMVSNGLRTLLDDYNIPVYEHRLREAVSFGAARYACEIGNSVENVSKKILEKYTEYSYGVWLPSENKLAGYVEFVLKSELKLPAESVPIIFTSATDRIVIKLNRSIKKFEKKSNVEVDDCVEIMRIPFDVPANTQCEIKIVALEDYNLKIICKVENGLVIEKSTSDLLKNLL